MPDYSVVLPLAETVDRRGSNLNMGIGDANMSVVGAALEGYQTGARNQLAIRGERLRQQAVYDPDRLFEEQLTRELNNRQLEQAIEKTDIALPLEQRRIESGIEATEAATALTEEKTRAAEVKADVAEKYGMEKGRLGIQKQRMDIAKIRADIAKTHENIRKSKEGLGLSLSERFRATSTLNSIVDDERRGINKEITRIQDKWKDNRIVLTAQMKQASGDKLTPKQQEELDLYSQDQLKIQTYKDKLDAVNKHANDQYRALGTWDPAGIGRGEGEEVDPHTAKITGYQNEANRNLDEASKTDETTLNRVAKDKTSRTRRQVDRNAANYNEADKAYQDGMDAVEDKDASLTPNFRAAKTPLEKLVYSYKQASGDDGSKEEVAARIDDVINGLGGPEDLRDYAETIQNKDEKESFLDTVRKATVATGKPENLLSEQRDLLALGFGEKDLEESDETIRDIGKVLSGNVSEVTNPNVHNLREHDLFMLAQQVSDNNKEGFTLQLQAVSADSPDGSSTARAYVATNTRTGQKLQIAKEEFLQPNPSTGQPEIPPSTKALQRILEDIGAKSGKKQQDNLTAEASVKNVEDTAAAAKPAVQPRARQQIIDQEEEKILTKSMDEVTKLTPEQLGYIDKDTGKWTARPEIKTDISNALGLRTVKGMTGTTWDKIESRIDAVAAELRDQKFKPQTGFSAAVFPTKETDMVKLLLTDVIDLQWNSLTDAQKAIFDNSDIIFDNKVRPNLESKMHAYLGQQVDKMNKTKQDNQLQVSSALAAAEVEAPTAIDKYKVRQQKKSLNTT